MQNIYLESNKILEVVEEMKKLLLEIAERRSK
jgi:hypothetical protein